MSTIIKPFGFLSSPWLVAGVSVAVLAALTRLLSAPWDDVSSQTSLRFYCAAGMTAPVQEIIDDYRAKYNVNVQPSYDGSGKLLAIIKATGGQGDLYLAADSQHVLQAEKLGLVSHKLPVAVIRPVLVVSAATQKALRDAGKPLSSLDDLFRSDLQIVIANPELASIGQMTKQMLESLGLWTKLEEGMRDRQGRVSTLGTVIEVASAVQLRDGCVGIVWDAVADQFGLEKISVPQFSPYSEKIWIAVLAGSKHPEAASRFARYVTARDRGLAVFGRHGFAVVPDALDWQEDP